MSEELAREEAKKTVKRMLPEERKANRLKEISTGATAMIQELTPAVGYEKALGLAHLQLARDLESQGMSKEASAMRQSGNEILRAEEQRLAEMDNLNARTAASRATADNAGETTFTKQLNARERVIAQLATATDVDEINRLNRVKGDLDAKIYKDTLVVGRSDADERAGGAKMAADLANLNSTLAQLDMLEKMLVSKDGSFATTKWGEMGASGAAFMESWFGIDPASVGADTLISDVSEINGDSTYLSAGIRHALTGAAMSSAEKVFLEPFLAEPADSYSQKLAKIRVVKRYLTLDRDTRTEYLRDKESGHAIIDVWAKQGGQTASEELRNKKASRPAAVGKVMDRTDAALDKIAAERERRRLAGIE
jgi:hypothetical protein